MAFLEQKPLLYGPGLALVDAGPQYGGSVVDYAHNLSFVTVHGSGHMVPQFRPRAALHMLAKLVDGEAMAPPMVGDAALGAMSDAQFQTWLDTWTERAQAAPYVPK